MAEKGEFAVRGQVLRFTVALTLAFLSGCAALGHELLWTRRLVDLLGASQASSTRVLSCFFLGLACGAAVTPFLLRRIRRPWRAVAVAEGGVAVLSLPALLLPQWSGWVWPALGPERLLGWQGSATKLLLSAGIVFPPAFCMGIVLPLMVRGVVQWDLRAERQGVWMYAANTFGGVGGLILASLVALPMWGASGAMMAATATSLIVAIGCLAIDRIHRPYDVGEVSSSTPQPGNRKEWSVALVAAFLSGFGILAFEVVALQLVSTSAPLSFFAPMAVLTCVVFLLGVTAATLPWLMKKTIVRPETLVWWGWLTAAVGFAVTHPWFLYVSQAIGLGPRANVSSYVAILLVTVGLALGPAMLAAGVVFPGLFAWLGSSGADANARRWGWLLASNGVGGLCGAELTYSVLLPTWGLAGSFTALGLLYAGTATLWGLQVSTGRTLKVVASLVIALAVAIGTQIPTAIRSTQLDQEGVVLDEQLGREGSVAVIDSPIRGRRIMLSGQYSLGATNERFDQYRMTHIPLLLHPQPQRVGFIGLATGITAGAALQHEAPQAITAIELSPLVVRAADQYFDNYNLGVTRDPRVRIVVEDGRTYLAASPGQFDVIVGDLFLPWMPGEARLYSLEHFRDVHAALRPAGLFCQWLAMYQLTPAQFDQIAHTFLQVFPRVYLFRNSFDVRFPALALVGFRDRELDWRQVETRCQALRKTDRVLDPVVRHVDGIGMMYLGRFSAGDFAHAEINTLSNMLVELSAGRERVSQPAAGTYVSGERWLEFVIERCLTRLAQDPGRSAEFDLARLGQILSVWDALRQHDGPLSREDIENLPSIRVDIERSFPPEIRADERADWSQWPGDVSVLGK